jgi:hypothetical protein
MKKIFLFYFIFIAGISIYAGKRPVIYVAAPSGISLREAPNRKAPKIETLAYGTRISNYNITEEWDTIDGYRGSWLRVAVNGKDGYIYQGYTIPVMPPSQGATLEKYLKEVLGERIKLDSMEMNWGERLVVHGYKRNILYQVNRDEFSIEYAFLNLNMTVQEAYLWIYLVNKNIKDAWDTDLSGGFTIPDKYPATGYSNGDLKVTRNDYSAFEMEIGLSYYLRIFRVQTNVVITLLMNV